MIQPPARRECGGKGEARGKARKVTLVTLPQGADAPRALRPAPSARNVSAWGKNVVRGVHPHRTRCARFLPKRGKKKPRAGRQAVRGTPEQKILFEKSDDERSRTEASVKKWMSLPNRSLSYTKQKKRRSKEHLFCVSTDLSYRTVAGRVLSA